MSALGRSHIQPNPDALLFWLVFDLDEAGAALAWERAGVAPPNVICINPDNGHAHALYALEAPVCRTEAGSEKAVKFAAAVQYALGRAMGADRGYSGLLCKNPLHPRWRVQWLHHTPYSLGELAEYVELPKSLPRRALGEGLGRNCSLFEAVSKWAYAEVRHYKGGAFDKFAAAVRAEAESCNAFAEPLPTGEVRAIARSVAKWVWSKFDIAASDARFSARQAHLGRIGGKASGETRRGKVTNGKAAAEALRAEGMTHKAIAAALGAGERTVYRWLS